LDSTATIPAALRQQRDPVSNSRLVHKLEISAEHNAGFAHLALPSRVQTSALFISFLRHVTQYLVWQVIEHIKEPYDLPIVLAPYHPALTEMLHPAISEELDIQPTGHEDEIQESSITPRPRSSGPSDARTIEPPRKQNGKFECEYSGQEFSSMYNLK
jgi:hypothetical protein